MTFDRPTPGLTFAPVGPQAPVDAPADGGLRDLVFGGIVTGTLLLVGAVAGLLWAWWSPPGPLAVIFANGAIEPDETESFIGADGRYLVIVAIIGLAAGLLAWRFVRRRGAVMVAALAAGSMLGSLAMWLVGYLTGGGDGTGAARMLTDGTPVHFTTRLPLNLQMHGLLFVQAAVAVLVYGLHVAFTSRDDLARPDPARAMLLAARVPQFPPGAVRPAPGGASVHSGDQPQDGWGYGDTPGASQQRDFPPQ